MLRTETKFHKKRKGERSIFVNEKSIIATTFNLVLIKQVWGKRVTVAGGAEGEGEREGEGTRRKSGCTAGMDVPGGAEKLFAGAIGHAAAGQRSLHEEAPPEGQLEAATAAAAGPQLPRVRRRMRRHRLRLDPCGTRSFGVGCRQIRAEHPW